MKGNQPYTDRQHDTPELKKIFYPHTEKRKGPTPADDHDHQEETRSNQDQEGTEDSPPDNTEKRKHMKNNPHRQPGLPEDKPEEQEKREKEGPPTPPQNIYSLQLLCILNRYKIITRPPPPEPI